MSEILKNVDVHTQPSLTLRNRLARLVWNIAYITLFRLSPVPFHPWRSFLLRCFGAKIGKYCHVYPKARIWAPWNLEMGDYSSMADGVWCYSMAKITVGEKVVISQGARLCGGTHDYTDPAFSLLAKPITIKSNAWIAAEAFICPGITIGEGTVVGARAVVTKDMPAQTVCAGNPCRPIKPKISKENMEDK